MVRSHFGSNNYWRLGIGRYARIGLYLCAGPPGTPFHHTATTSTENHYHYKYRKPLPKTTTSTENHSATTSTPLRLPSPSSYLPPHILPGAVALRNTKCERIVECAHAAAPNCLGVHWRSENTLGAFGDASGNTRGPDHSRCLCRWAQAQHKAGVARGVIHREMELQGSDGQPLYTLQKQMIEDACLRRCTAAPFLHRRTYYHCGSTLEA